MLRETTLQPEDLILPIFVHEHGDDHIIHEDLACIRRVSVEKAVLIAQQAYEEGISAVILFPACMKKSENAEEAYNPENLICSTIRQIKTRVPEIGVMADVALDPYTISGHDGILIDGKVDNDATVQILCKQAAVLASAGCDIIAPSDMMDGRVKHIREFLDNCSFSSTCILSYAAKFCSCLYSTFREVVDSVADKRKTIDKSTYQMDIANAQEALLEIKMDIDEGADFVMIKPGTFFLDIISSASKTFDVPIFAYQVSGEYAMIRSAAARGWVDYDKCMYESLMGMKRAGATAIVTYAALEVSKKLNSSRYR